jgi:hypothetical protein
MSLYHPRTTLGISHKQPYYFNKLENDHEHFAEGTITIWECITNQYKEMKQSNPQEFTRVVEDVT